MTEDTNISTEGTSRSPLTVYYDARLPLANSAVIARAKGLDADRPERLTKVTLAR